MSAIGNLPISRKFTLAFSLVCTLCVALGIYTVFTFRSVTEKSQEVGNDDFPSMIHLTEMRSAIHELHEADLQMLLCQTPACGADDAAKRKIALSDYQEANKAYQPFVTSEEERALDQKIEAAFARLRRCE